MLHTQDCTSNAKSEKPPKLETRKPCFNSLIHDLTSAQRRRQMKVMKARRTTRRIPTSRVPSRPLRHKAGSRAAFFRSPRGPDPPFSLPAS